MSQVSVGILGGTGDQGRGLAWRLAVAGVPVIVGSRDPERARLAAGEIGADVVGATNEACAAASDVVIAAVPWAGHGELLASLRAPLAGKVLVDCVNPLGFDQAGAFALRVPEGSAAEQAAGLLPDTPVVGAFHHVSAQLLLDRSLDRVETDVLVLGDDREATDLVQALAERIPGVRGIYGGRLRTCGQVEALTANLISVNRRYRVHAGLRVSGIPT